MADTLLMRMLWLLLLALVPLRAQSLSNASLSGRYYARQVLANSPATGRLNQAQSLSAVVTFDGNGGFSYTGRSAAGAPDGGSGSYSVSPTGLLTLSNPLRNGVTMSGRLGNGILAASTVEAGAGIFDLLVAIGAPAAGGSPNATLNGSWIVAGLDLFDGSLPNLRSTFFRLNAGGGSFGEFPVSGLAQNLGPRVGTQSTSGTFTAAADGTGTANFNTPAGAAARDRYLAGSKSVFVSRDGNFFLMGAPVGGVHDILIGVRPSVSAPQGLFYEGGLRADSGRFGSHVGSTNLIAAVNTAYQTRRVRVPEGVGDVTGTQTFRTGADGEGNFGIERIALGPNAYLISGVSQVERDSHSLTIGFRAPDATTPATGPYLNPFGAANAASFSPYPAPISPGAYVTLFGARLALSQTTASAAPFPQTLGNVQVLFNNRPAPLYVVAPGQIICLVPRATETGRDATVVAIVNGTRSNEISVPVARSAPALFTSNTSGFGSAAILRSDFTVITPRNPARRGETVVLFLNGLGAVAPQPADGAAAPQNPLTRVSGSVNVYIGGERAQVAFQGLTPGNVSLYQMNVVVPANAPPGLVPVGIETAEAFTDHASISIQP